MESKGLFVLAEAEHFLEIQACFPPVLSCFPLCQGAGRIPSPPQLLILSLIHLKRHQPPAWEPTAPRGLSKGKIVTRIGRTSGVTAMLLCSQEGFWGRGPWAQLLRASYLRGATRPGRQRAEAGAAEEAERGGGGRGPRPGLRPFPSSFPFPFPRLLVFPSRPFPSLPFPPGRALSEGGRGRSRPAHEEAAGSPEGRPQRCPRSSAGWPRWARGVAGARRGQRRKAGKRG